MPTEIKFLDGKMTVTAGEKAVVAVPYAIDDNAVLVSNGFEERDGDTLSPLVAGTRVETGETHVFETADGVRFVVEEIEPSV